MSIKSKANLTSTLNSAITDALNKQNTSVAVRGIIQDVIDSSMNLIDSSTASSPFISGTGIGSVLLNNGTGNSAGGDFSFASGFYNFSNGVCSNTEGEENIANGLASHAEGYLTIANGTASHAEGYLTIANGTASHAEGKSTIASGNSSHSQGDSTKSIGYASFASGMSSTASGAISFVHGQNSNAVGQGTVVLGSNINGTKANTLYCNNLTIPDGGIFTDEFENSLIIFGETGMTLQVTTASQQSYISVNNNNIQFNADSTRYITITPTWIVEGGIDVINVKGNNKIQTNGLTTSEIFAYGMGESSALGLKGKMTAIDTTNDTFYTNDFFVGFACNSFGTASVINTIDLTEKTTMSTATITPRVAGGYVYIDVIGESGNVIDWKLVYEFIY